jgi:hypothetical protein
MIEDTHWEARRREDGRFELVEPPVTKGIRRAHLNNLHPPNASSHPAKTTTPSRLVDYVGT